MICVSRMQLNIEFRAEIQPGDINVGIVNVWVILKENHGSK